MIFCKNPEAEIPIIELYDFIGIERDEFGIPSGISGTEVSDYIKFIEGQEGKKGIDIYINSVGGSIIDGMTIITAIKSCKLPVNTICVGVAVSMAGVILQAGKKRMMVKEGLMMIHPPSGGDAKELAALKKALIGFLNDRTDMTDEEMEDLMDGTSWLSANECLELNLIDEITDITSVANARETKKIQNATKRLLKIVNQLKTDNKPVNHNPMELHKIANLLGLTPDATEAQVLEGLKDLKNNGKKAEVAAKSALTTVRGLLNKQNDDEDEDKVKALKDEVGEMKKAYKQMEDDLKKAKKDIQDKSEECEDLKAQMEDTHNATAKNEAELCVDKAIEAGKIKAEAKDKFVNLYLADKDETIAILDGIVVSKNAAKMNITSSKTPDKNSDKKGVTNKVAEGKEDTNFMKAFKNKRIADFGKKA